MKGRGRFSGTGTLAILIAFLLVSSAGLVSCGGGEAETHEPGDDGFVLPPGMTEEELEGLNIGDLETDLGGSGSSGGEEGQEGQREQDVRESEYSALLAGARFTVVDATRNDTNKKVVDSSQREVAGDFLEIELAIENAGEDLVDLSEYSFRLESPAIEAADYRSYYGEVGALGKYVSEHVISAVLLDYADLSPVLYKLRIGEALEDVFLFYDLNPLNTTRNDAFDPDNGNEDTYLVIYKSRGSDSGREAKISLAGFAD